MLKIKKYKNIILGIFFLLFTVAVISWSLEEPEEKIEVKKDEKIEKKIIKTKEKEENKKIAVDVKGEIVRPGVYELEEKNNVNDAINMAGGLTEKSDTSNINLSKKLEDEMVIIVYTKQEIYNMKEKEKIKCPPCNDACIKESDEKSKIDTKEETSITQDEKININTADQNELQELTGIGKAKADSIIEYRNKNGNFKQIEDIKKVEGIGEAAYEKIKDNITV